MIEPVPRTVSEIDENGSPVKHQATSENCFDGGDILAGEDSTDWSKVLAGEDSPPTGSEGSPTLEEFRESDAYVLLGPPGSGKTTLFEKVETEHTGCHYVTARNFLALGEKPEWKERDATLFIDGLDEKRAGSPDGRTPLDDIRAKLETLGRPRFRLSCRETDWFGSSDRTHLETVSRDGRLKVLRLDPLSDEGIRALLNRRADVDDADAFIDEAREKGIDHLLTNPQTLKMLADAVSGGAWPRTRIRTFELACEKLVHEFNLEHRLANRDGPATPELLAAAGRLCAIQLLTGHAGYATDYGGGDSEHLGLESIPGDDPATLRLALQTRLFESPMEDGRRTAGRSSPVHRQVAEFLAARYLADLIDDGLPVGRVLALMTGEDGGIVSELRGLSAWLAAHSTEARRELIKRDPEGVAAYGDAGVFTLEEKRCLLECLCPVDPSLDASRFTSLVTPDMVPVLRDLLGDSGRGGEHRSLVLFLLHVLANATPVPKLGDVLLDLASNRDHSPNSRHWAAICLAIGAKKQPERFAEVVQRLMNDLREGRIPDERKDMLGRVLQFLYPEFIGPEEVFDYLDEDHEWGRYIGDRPGPYDVFWQHYLAMETRPQDVVIVLDKLAEFFERSDEWRLTGEPPASPLARRTSELVPKALEQADVHDARRVLRWLRLAGGDDWVSSQNSGAIRDWIEARPERYKELLRQSVAECMQSGNFDTDKWKVKRPLHRAKPASDYGRWCLEEIEHAEGNDNLTAFWFEEAWCTLLNGTGDDSLTLEHLEAVATTNATLVQAFDRLRFTDINSQLAKMQREHGQRNLAQRRKRKEALASWHRVFHQYEEALRDNRCPAGLLNTIAEAFLGSYRDIQGKRGEERLHEFLGEDELVEAAMDGLRNSIHRDDLPAPEEVLTFRLDNQRHTLAFPVVAGLELVSADDISRLEDERARLAIAMFLASRPPSPEPGWIRLLFETRPDLAAEEVVRVAAMAIRRGEHHIPFVDEMLSYEWLSEVARIACPKLLRSFSVRAPQHLYRVLKSLLWWGVDNLESSMMESVVAGKLRAKSMTHGQRAYWMAAKLVVSREPDPAAFEGFAEKHEKAIPGFFAFYERSLFQKRLLDRLPSLLISRLACLLGTSHRPLGELRPKPAEIRKSDLVRVLIETLGMRSDDEAVSALEDVASDPRMVAWHATVRRVLQEQQVIRRDACYRHPGVEPTIRTLESGPPANPADLAALSFDLLAEIALNIRDGSTNDWRQYWNVDRSEQSWEPRHEDDCRDALLSDFQARMRPLGVDAAPEGRYADEKRSDIRVSCGGFNVPVEIKKSSHRDLWSAIRSQLIAKYTRDPGAAGYGIYLVFWLGRDRCQAPESGSRPTSAAELEKRLHGTLSPEEARLISICVINVARP